jgi:acyl carrier protein
VNPTQLKDAVLEALYSVAPEAEGEQLDPAANMRDQLDIDSMDFLNFLVALKDAVGVEVPEADYMHVATLDDCVRYLAARLPTAT